MIWTMAAGALLGAPQEFTKSAVALEAEDKIYEGVLRILFPNEEKARGEIFSISILVRSESNPESQITISQAHGPTSRVLYRRVDRNINKLVRTTSNVNTSSREFADRITLEQKNIIVPSIKTFGWLQAFQSGLFGSVGTLFKESKEDFENRVVTVALDADDYEVQYSNGQTTIAVRFPDSGSKTLGARTTSLSAWIASVLREIDNMAKLQ